MSQTIKLKKGFDINLAGKAQNNVTDAGNPETFAIKPTDFPSITRPKLLVEEGDKVKAGTPVLFDKMTDKVLHCSPVSGEIVEVKRGAKRKLLEVKILADKEIEYHTHKTYSSSDLKSLSKEDAVEQMLKGGVWPNLVQRPYGIISNADETPKAIFVSCFDSHPLAPDYNITLKGQDEAFKAGLEVLKKLTDGKVHLNVSADRDNPAMFTQAEGVQINKISGKHPAGNVGVQIHHIDPIGKGDLIWTINPYGIAQIGKLFLEGKYDASKIVALTGSEVKNPQYYKSFTGSSIKNMVKDNIKSDHVRYISGNVLTGERIDADGYISFYDNQVTVIPEGDFEELLGWIKPTTSKLSFHRAIGLLSFMNPNKEYVLNTNTNGEERAFVMTGEFEKVLPMDILPTYLFKAIMAEDFDEMEALGIFEIIEEDVALCEFIDVSKHDLQGILRKGINLMING
ncbi:Na(+)-translocating NADH-quinone reductase subunit A [Marivirga atlantica]|jgi:Na+-transporting NADH:ubiquinone oxidoreductase subunit A|uniref:Na(+)-translocating NADH-quinone reductase subunit A n=1 Tax=Marivirga atlantica TaxID=1548457 RepID=A0A937DG02_9BACT|nr:Na(+)-translocating NADH-quinone reductase subunit A [Marivirga atlantica]MBL0766697.1 Na(+)-translocating NADH-quinone reductase subunit A [Marivirga atlantica]